MRYATILLTAADDQSSASDIRTVRIDGEVVARYKAIHYVDLLDDGTIVELNIVTGDTDRVAAKATASEHFQSYISTNSRDSLVLRHYEPSDLATRLVQIFTTPKISIDWPITYTDQGLQFTVFGEENALHQTIGAIPDALRVTLKRTGEYQPELRSPGWQLTDRQREVVRVAIAEGYYETPRCATHRDIAAQLDLAHGTVAEHLQKAEATLMCAVLGD